MSDLKNRRLQLFVIIASNQLILSLTLELHHTA